MVALVGVKLEPGENPGLLPQLLLLTKKQIPLLMREGASKEEAKVRILAMCYEQTRFLGDWRMRYFLYFFLEKRSDYSHKKGEINMMLKTKKRLTKGLAGMMVILMGSINVSGTVFAKEVTQTTEDMSLYLMIDPGETTSNFILEPTCIDIPAGTDINKNLGDIICDELEKNDINVDATSSHSYIKSIGCPDAFNYIISKRTYSMYNSLPNVAFHNNIVKPMDAESKLLGEYNFTGYSGWMFSINNEMSKEVDGKTVYYTLGTTVKDLMNMQLLNEDEDPVVQLYFSMNMGADIGLCDSYLPKEVTSYESAGSYSYAYNWAGDFTQVTARKTADKTELVKCLADNTDDRDYGRSLRVLKDLDASNLRVELAKFIVTH